MKRLLASLLFLLPVFIFSVSNTKAAESQIDCSNPAHAVVFGGVDKCNQLAPLINLGFKDTGNEPWYNQTATQFAHKVFDGSPDEIFGERYTYAQVNWIFNSLAAKFSYAQNPAQLINNLKNAQDLIEKAKNGKAPWETYIKMGPYGIAMAGVEFIISNKPASSITEMKNVAAKFDLASPVVAQSGYGYNGLLGSNGVLELWKAARNMSYFLMIILLIAAGFLIMFRVKINPQTVISIQTMIPKLIITMVLVTFSFAIAGFVIDMIYVIIGLFVSILSANGIMNQPGEISNVIGWLTNSSYWSYFALQGTGLIITFVILGSLAAASFLLSPAAGIVGVFLAIGLFLWVNWTMFKIFAMLVKAYVNIILQIIIGPLQIMLDLLPGQQGFGNWFRNLIANASVFVVVPIMLVIQFVLSWDIIGNNNLHLKDFGAMGGSSFGLPYSELFGNALTSGNIITRIIIGFTIFSMTPKIADMIRDALKIPAFKYGSAFDEALKPFSSLGKAATGMVINTGSKEISAGVRSQFGKGPRSTATQESIEAAGQIAQKNIGT